MLQRLALYAALGLVLDALGQTVTSTGFWLVLALFWAQDLLARREGFEQAEALSQAILKRANQMLEQAQQLEANKAQRDADAKQ